MLKVEELKFERQGYRLHYDFALPAASRLLVTGVSGVGKSTLLDLLAGFLPPDAGRLQYDGQDLLPLRPDQRPFSLLTQADNLFGHLTVRQNLGLGLHPGLRLTGPQQQALQAMAERLGLADFLTRPASQLSGGQQQRVALGRALLRQRPVLLLDEPFSALDEQTALEAQQLTLSLQQELGFSLVLVSHQVQAMLPLMAYRLHLSQGQSQFSALPAQATST